MVGHTAQIDNNKLNKDTKREKGTREGRPCQKIGQGLLLTGLIDVSVKYIFFLIQTYCNNCKTLLKSGHNIMLRYLGDKKKC